MLNFVNKVIKNAKIHDTITIENGVVLKLNKWILTAKIIYSPDANGDIFIPKSIIYDSKNYIITEICDRPFDIYTGNIFSIRFSEDSAIKALSAPFIHKNSGIMMNIPPNLEKMEFDIYFLFENFKKLDFYSSNENFAFLDEEKKLVASRYSQNHTGLLCYSLSRNNDFSGQFDNLLLAKKDITEAIIPSTITSIDSFCFSYCKNLKKIEFEEPSSLRKICWDAFFESTIEEFTIPSKVNRIMDGWCASTEKLKRLSVSSENSFFRMIDDKILVGKMKEDDQVFNTLLFANRDVKNVVIPSYIEFISEKSFEKCRKLHFVKFEKNSKLREIRSNAFNYSGLRSIEIPENVELIDKCAFQNCNELEMVVFPMNAKLNTLSDSVFECTRLKGLIVPPSVKKIERDVISFASLKSIEFLGENLEFEYFSIESLNDLILVSFTNAKKVVFIKMEDLMNLKNATIFICARGIIKLDFLESFYITFFKS